MDARKFRATITTFNPTTLGDDMLANCALGRRGLLPDLRHALVRPAAESVPGSGSCIVGLYRDFLLLYGAAVAFLATRARAPAVIICCWSSRTWGGQCRHPSGALCSHVIGQWLHPRAALTVLLWRDCDRSA
jgi:hypothetical protein